MLIQSDQGRRLLLPPSDSRQFYAALWRSRPWTDDHSQTDFVGTEMSKACRCNNRNHNESQLLYPYLATYVGINMTKSLRITSYTVSPFSEYPPILLFRQIQPAGSSLQASQGRGRLHCRWSRTSLVIFRATIVFGSMFQGSWNKGGLPRSAWGCQWRVPFA